jgi:SAM-dependent methyltransferase
LDLLTSDFNRLALLDDQGWTPNNHYHDTLITRVPQNCENALEVGCGTGAFARQLAKHCTRVIAIDLSPEMIRVAQEGSQQLQNLKFELADAMQYEFPRSHFDFICSIATLHHLEQRELLLKLKDALKPGGVLVVLDLVESNRVLERMLDVVAFGVSSTLRLIRNGRLQPPPAVRNAWKQHGQHDHYATVNEIGALANEILPGATVKRCLLWRYLMVYEKPATGNIAKQGSQPCRPL